MAGTPAGGRKAAQTNKERNGADFYKRIGMKGGRNGHTGGFAANPELARKAGAKGGRNSKRGGQIPETTLNRVRNYLLKHPEMTFKDIAENCGVGLYVVSRQASQLRLQGYDV